MKVIVTYFDKNMKPIRKYKDAEMLAIAVPSTGMAHKWFPDFSKKPIFGLPEIIDKDGYETDIPESDIYGIGNDEEMI